MKRYFPSVTHEDALEQIRDRIVDEIDPREIWLFGSAARGETDRHSDLDILVVVDYPEGETHEQNVRIRRAVSDIHISKDILSIRPERFDEERDLVGTLPNMVTSEGRQIYARE